MVLIGVTASLSFAANGSGSQKCSIRGIIDRPASAMAVTAVDRAAEKQYQGKIDAQTGRFIIEGLPPGSRFDLRVDYGGARLEGVDLTVPRSDYEEEQPASKEDLEAIKTTTNSLNKFEDKVEILAVKANIQHAAVLVNKLRTKEFINSRPGEVIWRLEVWRFEKPDETWVKVQHELFLVLYRERLQKSAFEKKSLTLDPRLGGLRAMKEKPVIDVGTVELPGTEPGIRVRESKRGISHETTLGEGVVIRGGRVRIERPGNPGCR